MQRVGNAIVATLITDLEFFLVEIPCIGLEPPVRSLVVRLSTNRGQEGWGEAKAEWRADELPGWHDALLPVLAGRSVFDIEDLLALGVLRSSSLRCALEMASWDLIGRISGQPLCHLFGGGYRPRIPLAVRLSDGTSEQIARFSRELSEQGFHWQIIPSSGRLDQDLERVAAVRAVVNERTSLRFDASANYDIESARDLCGELENAGLQYIVDPLKTRNLEQIASLRRQTSAPLAIWRAVHSPADVLAMVRCGAAPFAIVDLQLVGGLIPARKCAAIIQAAGLGASLSVGPSLGIAASAMLQLASASPAFKGCNEFAYHHLQDDLLVEPLPGSSGMAAVPQGPGLGIEVDRAKIEKYQVIH
jgi:L-alanine-DL-glutamate epimerase-like enolase superfamily enzyme